jgi:hypothetical protein
VPFKDSGAIKEDKKHENLNPGEKQSNHLLPNSLILAYGTKSVQTLGDVSKDIAASDQL